MPTPFAVSPESVECDGALLGVEGDFDDLGTLHQFIQLATVPGPMRENKTIRVSIKVTLEMSRIDAVFIAARYIALSDSPAIAAKMADVSMTINAAGHRARIR
jgi:hypothetical protein